MCFHYIPFSKKNKLLHLASDSKNKAQHLWTSLYSEGCTYHTWEDGSKLLIVTWKVSSEWGAEEEQVLQQIQAMIFVALPIRSYGPADLQLLEMPMIDRDAFLCWTGPLFP